MKPQRRDSAAAFEAERSAAALEEFRYWRFCAWNGYVFMGVFIVCWGILSGNYPPLAADLPATDVAAYFRANHNWIRGGMVISLTFVICYLIWAVVIGRVMGKVVRLKVRLVVAHFMELRWRPLPWRVLLECWTVAITLVIVGGYWLASA